LRSAPADRIRLALEGRYELALAPIVFARMLDAVDGRVARMIKAPRASVPS